MKNHTLEVRVSPRRWEKLPVTFTTETVEQAQRIACSLYDLDINDVRLVKA